MIEIFRQILSNTGLLNLGIDDVFMWAIGISLVVIAVKKNYEPLLLVPIGFAVMLVNIPMTSLMEPGNFLWVFHHFTIEKWDLLPPLIFLGVGAMTDFSPVIANPRTLILGAAAQTGVYLTFFCALIFGFDLTEAASIAIIGGADGPTTIYLGSSLAPHLLGATAVAAYSYMALVPLIQPPIMRALTTGAERRIRMRSLRKVGRVEKIAFPLIATIVICLLVPDSAVLVGMFMVGNLFRESGVVERLSKTAQNELINIVTIFLGLCIGGTMTAGVFLRRETLFIFFLGLFAFALSTASGILIAKLMNLFSREKINPLIGAAGVSAVPMASRVVQTVAFGEDKHNFILMHAMGPNVAGTIGTATAAGLFLSMLA